MVSFFARFRKDGDELDAAQHVERVLRGDRVAAERLVTRLLPAVQRRVAYVLSRGGAPRREDVLDYAQDVLVRLFEDDYRVLRTWRPERGASLEGFVALVAERHVITALRSGRKSGWREDPTEHLEDAVGADRGDLERVLLSKDLLERILDRLGEELNPRSRELFRALYVEEQSVEEVGRRFGMSANALNTWSSRLRSRVHALARELSAERVGERA